MIKDFIYKKSTQIQSLSYYYSHRGGPDTLEKTQAQLRFCIYTQAANITDMWKHKYTYLPLWKHLLTFFALRVNVSRLASFYVFSEKIAVTNHFCDVEL